MAPRSAKQWLLGYDATTIFRLWDPVRKRVHTSRDVTFNETELAGSKDAGDPSQGATAPARDPNIPNIPNLGLDLVWFARSVRGLVWYAKFDYLAKAWWLKTEVLRYWRIITPKIKYLDLSTRAPSVDLQNHNQKFNWKYWNWWFWAVQSVQNLDF